MKRSLQGGIMAKYMFLIRPPNQVDLAALKSQVLDKLVPRLFQLNPEKLKVDLTEPKRPRLTVLPLRKNHLAMISVWDGRADRAQQWQSEMAGPGWSMAGYQITESTPRAYTKDWKDGEASPGIVMLTLMNRNRRLSYEQFMKEWFEHHTPNVALKVHPLWNYIRNVVDSVVVAGSPPLDGIVEEHSDGQDDACQGDFVSCRDPVCHVVFDPDLYLSCLLSSFNVLQGLLYLQYLEIKPLRILRKELKVHLPAVPAAHGG